jgi:hypothetical protein
MNLRRLSGRTAPIILPLALVLTLGFGPADSPLKFVDETPLDLTLEKATQGTSVVVCNFGQDPLTNMEARFVGFDFPTEKGMREPKTIPAGLGVGSCQKVPVRAEESLKQSLLAKPGRYQGLLVLSTEQTGRVVRQVIVEAPAATISSAAKPVWVTTKSPSVLAGNRSPVTRKIDLPLKVKNAKSLSVKREQSLGVLSGGEGDGQAKVFATKKLKEAPDSSGVVSVPVRVEGLEGVGTYSGTLTAGGVDFEEQLVLSDSLGWAVGCVAIGLFISILLLVITKRSWPVATLKGRAKRLSADYKTALAAFKGQLDESKQALEDAGSDPNEAEAVKERLEGYELDTDDVENYRKNFVYHLKAYIKDSFFVDTSSQVYKDVFALLETAESDARHLGSQDGFGKALKDLAVCLDGFCRFLRNELRPKRPPALATSAAAPLRGGKLKANAAKEVSARAKESVSLIASWCDSAKRVRRYEAWAKLLDEKLEHTRPWPPKEDADKLVLAAAKVVEAENELLDAENASVLKDLGTDQDLKEAYETLASLGAKYDVWPPIKPLSSPATLFAAPFQDHNAPVDVLAIKPLVAKPQHELPSPPTKMVSIRPVFGNAWAALALVLGVLLAVVGVLATQVYPAAGTPFGTTKDYLAAIVAGATGPAVVQFLQGPLTTFLTRLRPGA